MDQSWRKTPRFSFTNRVGYGSSTQRVAPATLPWEEEEERVFRSADRLSAVVIPMMFFFNALWWLTLIGISGFFPHDAPGTRFLVLPSFTFWAAPSLFLGQLTAFITLDRFLRNLLGERYVRYRTWLCRHLPFLESAWTKRADIAVIVLVLIGSIVATHAGITSYARFSDWGIQIRRPLSSRSQLYDYGDVEAIEHRATYRFWGKVHDGPHYAILFNDGTAWKSNEGLRDPVPDLDERIARFVAFRSGRPIVERP